jgi:hypothetical protein
VTAEVVGVTHKLIIPEFTSNVILAKSFEVFDMMLDSDTLMSAPSFNSR